MKEDRLFQNMTSFPRFILVIFFILLFIIAIIVSGKARAEEISPDLEKEMINVREAYRQEKYLDAMRRCNKVIAKFGNEAVEAGAVLNLSIRKLINSGFKKAENYYEEGDYLKSITTTYATILFAVSNNHPPPKKSYDLLDKAIEAYLKTLPGSI